MSVEGRAAALRGLAEQTRHAIAELMTTTASDAAVVAAGEHVARAAELLAGQPHGRPYEGVAESAVGGDPRAFADFSPFVGLVNPLAPPIVARMDGDQVVGTVTFGAAYEGPPGCVHGGYIAAGFDEILGFAQSVSGQAGMTGRLEVSYRRPTPLDEELVFRGWLERIDGRKLTTRGTLHAGDVLTAEAMGLFISMKPELLDALMNKRGPHLPR